VPRALAAFDYALVQQHIRELHWSSPRRHTVKGEVLPAGPGQAPRVRLPPSPTKAEVEAEAEAKAEASEEKETGSCIEKREVRDINSVSSRTSSTSSSSNQLEQDQLGEGGEGGGEGDGQAALSDDELLALVRAKRRKKGTLKAMHRPS